MVHELPDALLGSFGLHLPVLEPFGGLLCVFNACESAAAAYCIVRAECIGPHMNPWPLWTLLEADTHEINPSLTHKITRGSDMNVYVQPLA